MALAWRVAHSLNVLLAQLNAKAPNRNKASDGSIGDANHQNRSSDHNPWYGPGIVTARDFTHDPAGGLDCHWLAATLVAQRDARIKYIIWDKRILSGSPGPSPWMWRAYTGANPHTHHLHLSVVDSELCDNTAKWGGIITKQKQEDEMVHVDTISKAAANEVAAAVFWGIPFAGPQNFASVELDNRNRDAAILQAVLALAGRSDITKEELAEVVNKATPNAEDVAREILPGLLSQLTALVRDIVSGVLDEDNADQAREILRQLGNRLQTEIN